MKDLFENGKDATPPEGRKRAKKSLGEDPGNYRSLVEDLPELICRFLPDTTLTYVNKAYCRYLGKSQEELVGHRFLPFLPEEYKEALKEHLASLSREDPVGTFEERVRKPDGEVGWQQWINRAVYDEEGNLVEYHGVGRDLSAQELVEEALLESEERYRNLADATFEGVAISEDGEILYANLAFARMFGYEPSEIRGMDTLAFKAPEERDLVWQKISSGFDEPYESVGLKKNGARFPVEIRGKTASHKGRTFRVSTLRDLTEYKKTEEELRKSEELYRAVVEDQTELICRFLPDGTLTLVNEAYCCYFGKEREELIGESFMTLLPEEDREGFKEHLASLTPNNPVKTTEHRAEVPGGETRWQQWTGRAIFDEEGDPVEYQSVGRDITERKEAEARLRESEERFRTAFEDAPIGVALVGLDMRYLRVNHALCEMLDYPEEELLQKTSPEVIHPDDREVSAERVRQALEEGLDGYTIQRRYVRGDGRVAWNLTSVSLIRDPEGEPSHFVCLHQDVTERKEAEEALEESEERYRAVVEQSMESIWLFDPDSGEVLESNAAFQELLGYAARELRGMTVYDLVPRSREDIDENIQRNLLQKARNVSEREYRRKDGSLVDVETTVTAIPYEGREVLCAVARDVTERKKAEAKLREAEEKYRSIFENAVEGIYQSTPEGRFVSVNPALARIFGYSSPEEMIATLTNIGHQLYVDPDQRDEFARLVEENHEVTEFESRIYRKDGSIAWVSENARAVRDDDGALLYYEGFFEDITERKEVEESLRKSEEGLAEAQRMAHLGSWEWDVKSGEVLWSDETFRIYGYDPEEFVPSLEKLMEVVHPDDRELVEKKINAAFDENEPYDFEHRIVRPDGEERVVYRRAEVVLDEEGEPLRMIGTVHDITERKEAEEALRESEEFHRAVMEQSVESIYLFDPETKRVLDANATIRELLGYTSKEFLRMKLHDFFVHDKEDIDRNVERSVLERQRYVGERRYRHKDGSTIEVEASATVIPYYGREVVCVVVRDVTERKELEEQLRYQAFHDSLTELPNRALFLNRLEHALAASERSRESVAVLFLDLDDFKVVNDSMGHEAGNRLLVEAAERLQTCVRPGDTVGRIFGDEFAVLLQAPADVDEARQVTERIVERLQRPFSVDGRETYVSCSVGITQSDPNQEDQPKEVLRRADLAMYAAKSRGKDAYEVYNPSMNERAIQRLELENDLRRAVEREEFEVHYQPIVRVSTGEIDGFEALARWKHPERGFVAPEEFIDLAEETGLIRPIGRWVFEEACRQACRWREQHPERKLRMGVNFSTSQFSHQADTISEILSETGLDPSALQLEITERAVMDNAEFAIVKLQKLKNLGIQFAIDDYGTGYSCLYYLKHMPVDSLKIDRSFVAGLGENLGDTAIVSGTIDLSHALGLKVVAEGIEDERQLAKLKELGCDLAQGYYFAEPLPSEGAERLLKEGFSC